MNSSNRKNVWGAKLNTFSSPMNIRIGGEWSTKILILRGQLPVRKHHRITSIDESRNKKPKEEVIFGDEKKPDR